MQGLVLKEATFTFPPSWSWTRPGTAGVAEHGSTATSQPRWQRPGGQVSSASNGPIYWFSFSLKWNKDWQITWSLAAAPVIQHVASLHIKLSYTNKSNPTQGWSILRRQSQSGHHCLRRCPLRAIHGSARYFNCPEAAGGAVESTR